MGVLKKNAAHDHVMIVKLLRERGELVSLLRPLCSPVGRVVDPTDQVRARAYLEGLAGERHESAKS
jgi:hypothetical protein